MTTVKLSFWGEAEPRLLRSCFSHPLLDRPISAVCGRTAGAFGGFSSFQWTKAVRALSVLMVRAALYQRAPAVCEPPIITGEKGSLAASLNYALQKQPLWLSDCFGTDSGGRPLLRRLVGITNHGGRKAGPIYIGLTQSFVSTATISIELEGQLLVSRNSLECLTAALEQTSTYANSPVLAGNRVSLAVVGG